MADSFNEYFGYGSHSPTIECDWPLQDDAASATVVDRSGNANHGTYVTDNTEDVTTTGPNSYWTKALDFDGSSRVSTPQPLDGAARGVMGCWVRTDSASVPNTGIMGDYISGDTEFCIRYDSAGFDGGGSNLFKMGGQQKRIESPTNSAQGQTWQHVVVVRDASDVYGYINGSPFTPSGSAGTQDATMSHAVFDIGRAFNSGAYHDGQIAGAFADNPATIPTDSDIAEIYNGPEPIVISGSNTISGTEQQGETLTASIGTTWGVAAEFGGGSDGTITKAYEWYRADEDEGTYEATISGATSTTYECQAADVGKVLRIRERGNNSGGYDPGADYYSAYTGTIAAGGGGGAAVGRGLTISQKLSRTSLAG